MPNNKRNVMLLLNVV